jgi:nucleotide-binding universal stress UspA family protein
VPIGHVLCPVDFSDGSRAAVDRAVALARPTRADITGLFVLPAIGPVGQEASSHPSPEVLDEGVVSALTEDLQDFLRPAREAGLAVRARVRIGDCVAQILDQARATDADLVVMGTHGRSRLARFGLGSVAATVLRKSACPVVTVGGPSAVRKAPSAARIERILCALDLTERSAHTLAYAVSLARSTGATLMLVHVLQGAGRPSVRAQAAEDARQRLHAAGLTTGMPAGALEEVAVFGRPYREIVRLARERPVDLIVLGTGGDEGSIAGRVVRRSPAPVLTVRAGAGRERAPGGSGTAA